MGLSMSSVSIEVRNTSPRGSVVLPALPLHKTSTVYCLFHSVSEADISSGNAIYFGSIKVSCA
jgi:hypothetical protein